MTRGAEPDRWSRWLLERRGPHALEFLRPVRDRVLAAAEPLEGATVLDVGAGDGLIGLGALARVGPLGRVIFSDVSPALLDHLRALTGDDDRTTFLQARAEDLAGIEDGTVDVVTTRSVLIFVDDKAAAFAAMRRVLAPGGRISLFEPVNRLMFPEPDGSFWGYDVAPVADLATRVAAVFATRSPSAMRDFDDRDLARLVEAAGFARVHVETHCDVERVSEPLELETLLGLAPNPDAPTLHEALNEALDAPERERFLATLGPAAAGGTVLRRQVAAYVTASG